MCKDETYVPANELADRAKLVQELQRNRFGVGEPKDVEDLDKFRAWLATIV